jgi:hypothetical protein
VRWIRAAVVTQSTLRNFLVYLEGPLSFNIPPRKEEGYYAYSFRVGAILGLVKE